MRRLGLVTAAFAAGVMGFAVNSAGSAPLSLRADHSPTPRIDQKVSAAETAESTKPSAAGKKTGSAARAKAGRAKLKVEKAAAEAKKPARTRKAKRARARIDPTKTASIQTKAKGATVPVPEARPAATSGGSAAPYSAIIAKYAASYGVPVSLANAVIQIESNYRPNITGSAGEIGLMQIKPETARMMGYEGSVKGLYDPETNIKYGMKYLAMAQDLGDGSTCSTILKYNAGHAATRMNPVSSAYCSKVKIQLVAAGTPA